jgi:hypothetical protein
MVLFKIEEPICNACNVLNDIIHFLIDCQKFALQRADLVSYTTNHIIVLDLQSVVRKKILHLLEWTLDLFQN